MIKVEQEIIQRLGEKLGFRIDLDTQCRGQLIWLSSAGNTRAVRPASTAEITMWKALLEGMNIDEDHIKSAIDRAHGVAAPKEVS